MSKPNFTRGPWIFNAHDGSITDSSAANNDIAEVYDGWEGLGFTSQTDI